MPIAIGVDVGGTKMLAVSLDADGTVLDEARRATPAGSEALVTGVADLVEALEARAPTGAPAAGPPAAGGADGSARPAAARAAVGLGVPGLVDRQGRVQFSPNLPGVVRAPVRELLSARLDRPVAVENDATAAAWAEARLGAAAGAQHALVVTLGTGIGGGIVTGGHLMVGRNGFAGEIGHMVVDPHGPPCPCGQRGCWERYASGSGLGRLARDAAQAGRAGAVVALAGGDPEAVRGEHVTAAAAAGDEGALEIIRTFSWWLAVGVANLVAAFDPEVVVLGGGMIASADLLLGPAREALGHLVEGGTRYRPEVALVGAQLGERAGAIGAALLGRDA